MANIYVKLGDKAPTSCRSRFLEKYNRYVANDGVVGEFIVDYGARKYLHFATTMTKSGSIDRIADLNGFLQQYFFGAPLPRAEVQEEIIATIFCPSSDLSVQFLINYDKEKPEEPYYRVNFEQLHQSNTTTLLTAAFTRDFTIPEITFDFRGGVNLQTDKFLNSLDRFSKPLHEQIPGFSECLRGKTEREKIIELARVGDDEMCKWSHPDLFRDPDARSQAWSSLCETLGVELHISYQYPGVDILMRTFFPESC